LCVCVGGIMYLVGMVCRIQPDIEIATLFWFDYS
jgi:hypothetical protein